MNKLKKGIALFLCTVMCIPSIPAAAENRQEDIGNVVKFNTGSYEYCVVEEDTIDELQKEFVEKYGEDYADNQDAVKAASDLNHYDAWNTDGSYEIQVEQDAFFPYEVQFTYDGKTDSQWFMTSDSTVEVAGHTFRLDVPQASGNAVTQMELNVEGNTVIVYPEAKEFTNDENGKEAPASLIPLTEKRFRADFSMYTPIEMTKVTIAALFKGQEMPKGTSVMWKSSGSDLNYKVGTLDNVFDIRSYYLEMIIGEKDQLEAEKNIRYIIYVDRPSSDWLEPSLYVERNGTREAIDIRSGYSYIDELYMSFYGTEEKNHFLSLSLGSDYQNQEKQYDEMRVFDGKYAEAELPGDKDITGKILDTGSASEYRVELDWGLKNDQWVTFVTYKDGSITGCLPVKLEYYKGTPYTGMRYPSYLYQDGNIAASSLSLKSVDGVIELKYTMTSILYPVNGKYTIGKFSYLLDGEKKEDGITAYVGQYDSISAAQTAGAQDVTVNLFKDGDAEFEADFSQDVIFSVFFGPDGEGQESYHYCVKTEERIDDLDQNSAAYAFFTGVVMQKPGNPEESVTVPSYILNSDFDSYGDGKFYTIFVDKKVDVDGTEQPVDLKNLALKFTVADGAKLYAEGQNGAEESGKSFHDYSQKAMQFSVSSGDGDNHKNYFVRIIQVKSKEEEQTSQAQLYVNSLDDSVSKSARDEQGVITSTREVFLDSYHNNVHDILVSNVGYQTMSALKVELTDAADLELDEYWTLQGKNGLSGLTTVEKTQDAWYAELPNLAMVRLNAKQGKLEAKDYGKLGTLTFKSGDQTKMVLTLTGIVGDPRIVTKEIKNPTKYVPYGIMIMDNNKYDFNRVTYSCTGKLPDGMTLMPSGELYGVPKESGEFEITVTMNNSYYKFADDTRTFKFTVLDNTDTFVDQAEDDGYKLTKRISGIYDTTANGDYLIISEGVFDQYTDLYIDGEKLQRGTDYDAESGSTRITIAAQSLPKSEGTHTIGVEFRQDKSQGKVKAAAQNYHVTKSSSSGGGGGSWSGGSTPSSGGSRPSNSGSKPSNSDSSKPADNNTTPGSNSGSNTTPGSNTKPTDNTGVSGGKDTSLSKDMMYARLYTVVDGDTLKSLAKKFYGKSSKWKKIYDANKGKIPSSKQLKAGMKLKIPAINYTVKKGDTIKTIAKKYFGANSKWKLIYQVNRDVISSSLKLKAGQKLVLPVPVVCRIYTVKKGDTLEKIAKKFYGKSSKWIKIYNANKNKVSASKKVKPGVKLFIPAMTYTVKKGDDIKSIAKKYYGSKTEWRQIYNANKDIVPKSKKLKEGTTLVLPVPVDIG